MGFGEWLFNELGQPSWISKILSGVAAGLIFAVKILYRKYKETIKRLNLTYTKEEVEILIKNATKEIMDKLEVDSEHNYEMLHLQLKEVKEVLQAKFEGIETLLDHFDKK